MGTAPHERPSPIERCRDVAGIGDDQTLVFRSVTWEVDDHASIALVYKAQRDPAVLPRRPGPPVDQESRWRTVA